MKLRAYWEKGRECEKDKHNRCFASWSSQENGVLNIQLCSCECHRVEPPKTNKQGLNEFKEYLERTSE